MARKTSPVRESRKIEKQYRDALMTRVKWLQEHQEQLIRELKVNETRYQGDAPSSDLRIKINKLRELYMKRFPFAMNQRLAKTLFSRINKYNQSKMGSAFEAIGIDLKEQLKREKLEDYAGLSIQNNVDLISSISDEYFDKIEKVVYNGMMAGQDYQTLGKKIMEATGATAKRAKFIARDQTSTINAQLSRKRASAAGLTRGVWNKTKFNATSKYKPRQSHISADGKEYDLEKGLLVDGEYIHPGEAINCTCVASYVTDQNLITKSKTVKIQAKD